MYLMGKEEIKAVTKVLESQQFMRYRGGEGGFTEKFEKNLCKKLGVKHAIAVNSGTGALIAALVGLGIGPGDEVIVPAYTWVASALAPLAVGAVPILADIDESLMIDPADIERKITRYTKAIIPVHMANLCCDMNKIMKIAKKHKILVVEDACQGVGLSYKGKRLGTIGHAGAFSFNQFKNITCGEGGAVLTNDDVVYDRAMIYHDTGAFTRDHASKIKEPFFAGVNYRVSEVQGAILYEQLKRMDGIVKKLVSRRKAIAEILSKGKGFKICPHNDPVNAAAIHIIFKTIDEAADFAETHQLSRPIGSGRHVYTNWEPLMKQKTFHPKMNPYKWAHRKIKYTKNMCSKTLELLSRTCAIPVPFDMTISEVKKMAKSYL